MPKYHGKIGFAKRVEKTPGNWKDEITEREYFGDVLQNTNRWDQNQTSTNDNFSITNRISVVADSFMLENYATMRYISYRGELWKITSADDTNRPRIILSLGGVWNGKTAS